MKTPNYLTNYLNRDNISFIEELWAAYQLDAFSVDDSWRYFFDGVHNAAAPSTPTNAEHIKKEWCVQQLIESYRLKGGKIAFLNPLQPPPPPNLQELSLAEHHLKDEDLSTIFQSAQEIGLSPCSLQAIIEHLKKIYCATTYLEYPRSRPPAVSLWLQKHFEQHMKTPTTPQDMQWALALTTQSTTFERFLHTKYVAQKRFSLEGNETLIPLLQSYLETIGELGATTCIIGMSHRGRLNVLKNILHKPMEAILADFEGIYPQDTDHGDGDVKYHKGYSNHITLRSGKHLNLSVAYNPSHLEFVNPIVLGITRAKQTQQPHEPQKKVASILLHGDAAFAGQGVCYETLGMAKLVDYDVGGTLHVVVNNQIGFTTDPSSGRYTPFATDIAHAFDIPILHVNAHDIEAVWKIARLAAHYRYTFASDIIIDLIGYRKHGHNEGDEPAFTQPLLYQNIRQQLSAAEQWVQKHTHLQEIYTKTQEASQEELSQAQSTIKSNPQLPIPSPIEDEWKKFYQPTEQKMLEVFTHPTSAALLTSLATECFSIPASTTFTHNPKLERILESRLHSVTTGENLDWGTAETLAYASILHQGISIRLAGQDVQRGTFSHRHAVLHSYTTEGTVTPLQRIAKAPTEFEIINSPLTETGALGFETGYAYAHPETLVIWEAQFGDFANGAQVIIDQFISSTETKWQKMNGITLLLPHGYEGQGPEHSSARLERFLQLSAQHNWFVCNLSHAAQIFHCLKRQALLPYRKPLVIMSPKSLLRNPKANCSLKDLTEGRFYTLLEENLSEEARKKIHRVLLCSGKIGLELLDKKNHDKREDVAIIRVEQLYPLDMSGLDSMLKSYPNAKKLYWVQEEPYNMGAWSYIFMNFYEHHKTVEYIGRMASPSPAVGYTKRHEKEQLKILTKAFA